MKRKIVNTILIICILMIILPRYVSAADNSMKFSFELSVDGKDTIEVENGDIITVLLTLKNMYPDKPYMMYAMQNEIHYDSEFFEFVEGSERLYTGVVSTDIAMVDNYREFYMNYLSMSGGTQWNGNTIVGSFQLKVRGTSGVAKITNQDYLVSLKDGSGTYSCTANELTVVLTTECTVNFMTNGGNAIESQIVQYGEKIKKPEDPTRAGYTFIGWYTDIHLEEEWDFENNFVESNISLYAKWVEGEPEYKNEYSYWWWILMIFIVIIAYLIWKKIKRMKNRIIEN